MLLVSGGGAVWILLADRVCRAIMNQEIREFWVWFASHAVQLRSAKTRHKLHDTLGQKLGLFGFFDWEIGPCEDSKGKHYLTIQLSDYHEHGVRLMDLFFSLAPELNDWKLLTARPPKQWSRQLLWGKTRELISATGWLFSLYRYEDGKFDIVLNTPLNVRFDEEEKRNLVVTVLASELGDFMLNEKVNAIDIEEKISTTAESGISLHEIANVLSG